MHMQPADVRQGMINIRSDEDSSPQDVLDEMTPEQAAKVGRASTLMYSSIAINNSKSSFPRPDLFNGQDPAIWQMPGDVTRTCSCTDHPAGKFQGVQA
jgi:hypothetical protein